MDYFQGVVTEYLRADRAMFVNPECLIQLEPGDSPAKGRHWYCDAMAASFKESTVYLCEVTYSQSLHSLIQRLQGWSSHWPDIRLAITRDCAIPNTWPTKPWVFIPKSRQDRFDQKFPATTMASSDGLGMPYPKVTHLEKVVPWEYRTWDRRDEIEEDKRT